MRCTKSGPNTKRVRSRQPSENKTDEVSPKADWPFLVPRSCANFRWGKHPISVCHWVPYFSVMKPNQIKWLVLKYVVVLGAVSTICAGCFMWTSGDKYEPAVRHDMLAGTERGGHDVDHIVRQSSAGVTL